MHEQLERHQVWLYLVAILSGMAIGWSSPEQTRDWELLLWPVLGVLLYTTFTQVPLIHLRLAFRDGRFLAALPALAAHDMLHNYFCPASTPSDVRRDQPRKT